MVVSVSISGRKGKVTQHLMIVGGTERSYSKSVQSSPTRRQGLFTTTNINPIHNPDHDWFCHGRGY